MRIMPTDAPRHLPITAMPVRALAAGKYAGPGRAGSRRERSFRASYYTIVRWFWRPECEWPEPGCSGESGS